MQRGRSFIGAEKPSILSSAYNPFRDEADDHDYWPVFPERMIRLTYDIHAEIEVELRRWIQDEIDNGYEVMAAATLTLRPDGDEIFAEDDYPTAFYAYLDDLLNFLTGGPLWTRMR